MQVIQESIIEKAKDFISKHKGKLITAAAIGGAGFLGYKLGHSNTNDTKNITNINVTIYRSNKVPANIKSLVNDVHANTHTNTQIAPHPNNHATQHTDTQSNFGSSKIINTDDDF